MDELSIVLSILDVAEEETERRGGARVTAIHLKLGPLSGVVRKALQSAFALAREGSSLPTAKLSSKTSRWWRGARFARLSTRRSQPSDFVVQPAAHRHPKSFAGASWKLSPWRS